MPCCCACRHAITSGVRYFRLPRKDPERYTEWANNIGREEPLPQHAMLCEKHFTQDQFDDRADKKLKWNAVPTIFDNETSRRQLPKSRKRKREEDHANGTIVNEASPEHGECQAVIKNLQSQLAAAHDDIKTLKDKNTNLTNNLKEIFEPAQIEQFSTSPNGQKWTPTSMRKYLKLYLTCGTTGYEELRRQKYPIPAIRTLQRRMQSFKCMPELHSEIFHMLETKVECLLPQERHAVLLIDEMAIKPGLQFDNNSGEVVGRPTLKNSGAKKTDEYATHALVFMLAGISTRWKQTIGYQFTSNSYDAHEANELISKIISKCESIGLDVCAVISDMGPQNQAVWRINNIVAGRSSKIKTSNNITINDGAENKNVHFIPDPTHIYKNIRLALTENIFRISEKIVSKYNLPCDEISLEPITSVIEEDKDVELKAAPYLKEMHIQPNHFDKMKVQGAMAVLNHDVGAAIRFYISKGRIPAKHTTTAWFLETVHQWYHVMSSRTMNQGLAKSNVDDYKKTIDFLEDFIDITRNVHIGMKGHWKPIQTGILLSTEGVLKLQEKFFNSYHFDFLLLSRFTQDALENLFSNIRSRNPVPTAKEFKTALRLISVSQYFAQPTHGSYGVTNDVPLVDFLNPNNNSEDSVDDDSGFRFDFDTERETIGLEERQSLYYLLGSIVGNIKKNQLHCRICMASVTASDVDGIEELKSLTDLKSYKEKSLIYPSKQIFDVGLHAENFFRQHATKLTSGEIKLEQLTPAFLKIVDLTSFPECHNILKRFISLFFKNRIHILLKSRYSCFKPADSARCSSRSIGMRVAVMHVV